MSATFPIQMCDWTRLMGTLITSYKFQNLNVYSTSLYTECKRRMSWMLSFNLLCIIHTELLKWCLQNCDTCAVMIQLSLRAASHCHWHSVDSETVGALQFVTKSAWQIVCWNMMTKLRKINLPCAWCVLWLPCNLVAWWKHVVPALWWKIIANESVCFCTSLIDCRCF